MTQTAPLPVLGIVCAKGKDISLGVLVIHAAPAANVTGVTGVAAVCILKPHPLNLIFALYERI